MAGDTSAANAEQKSRKGSRIVVILLLAVIIALGIYIFLGRSGADETAAVPGAPGEAAAVMPISGEIGHVIELEPIFINLDEGRYLKLAMALQTPTPHADFGEGEMPNGAMAMDSAITIFSNKTVADLTDPAMRDTLKEELVDYVVQGYRGHVTGVYFTEFVMQ